MEKLVLFLRLALRAELPLAAAGRASSEVERDSRFRIQGHLQTWTQEIHTEMER